MTEEQEKETIKYLEFLKKEYLEDAKQRKENGEIIGSGTMEDIDKLRALHIGFALNMLKQKDKMIDLLAEKLGEITIKICPYDELKIDCSVNSKNYWIEYFKQKATEMLQEGE